MSASSGSRSCKGLCVLSTVSGGGISAEIDPDFDGVELDRDNIVSGSGALLTYLLQIAGVEDSGTAAE